MPALLADYVKHPRMKVPSSKPHLVQTTEHQWERSSFPDAPCGEIDYKLLCLSEGLLCLIAHHLRNSARFLTYVTTVAFSLIKTLDSPMIQSLKVFKASWTTFISKMLIWISSSSCPYLRCDTPCRCTPQPGLGASMNRRNDGRGTWRETPRFPLSSCHYHHKQCKQSSDKGTDITGLSVAGDQWDFSCHWKGWILTLPLETNHSSSDSHFRLLDRNLNAIRLLIPGLSDELCTDTISLHKELIVCPDLPPSLPPSLPPLSISLVFRQCFMNF